MAHLQAGSELSNERISMDQQSDEGMRRIVAKRKEAKVAIAAPALTPCERFVSCLTDMLKK